MIFFVNYKKKIYFNLKYLVLICFFITNISFADTKSFTFTGSDVSWTVPTGAKSITIEGYGAEGGTGGNSGGAGGKGGYLKATISVTAGDSLTIRIGQKGHNGIEDFNQTSTVFGDGGRGGGDAARVAGDAGGRERAGPCAAAGGAAALAPGRGDGCEAPRLAPAAAAAPVGAGAHADGVARAGRGGRGGRPRRRRRPSRRGGRARLRGCARGVLGEEGRGGADGQGAAARRQAAVQGGA